VVKPKQKDRNTCHCKIHDNQDLKRITAVPENMVHINILSVLSELKYAMTTTRDVYTEKVTNAKTKTIYFKLVEEAGRQVT